MLLTTDSPIFADLRAVYVPMNGSSNFQWTTPKKCVWEAPKFLDVRHSLATVRRYRDSSRLKCLFNVILEIHNAGCSEYLRQVVYEKRCREPRVELSTVYTHILEETPDEQSWELIRYVHATRKMTSRTWH